LCFFLADSKNIGAEKDGRIILRWIFREWDVGAWTGSM
jgi:hypothetical protein